MPAKYIHKHENLRIFHIDKMLTLLCLLRFHSCAFLFETFALGPLKLVEAVRESVRQFCEHDTALTLISILFGRGQIFQLLQKPFRIFAQFPRHLLFLLAKICISKN